MRVLLISHTCQSLTEGQPRAAAIAARLHGELLVLTPSRWKHYGKWRQPQAPERAAYRLVAENVLLPWAGPGQFYLHCYPRLGALIKDFQPDVIDIWEEPWSLVSAQACWLARRLAPKAAIVSETEQNMIRAYPPPFRWCRSYTFSKATFVVCRSAEALEVARNQGYGGPAETVPNAVDADLFSPMNRESCRDRLGLKGFVIGYVGRIVERKGLMDLVNALPLCPESAMLVLAGSGNDRATLEARIAQLGMKSRVRFMPEIPYRELPVLMNALDLLALPSRTTPTWKEQFGRVIIEAHACGTPVIGSSSGAIPDVVGKGGLIFREGDPANLAECITLLAKAPDRVRELGAMGRCQVLDHYTWGRVAERMLSIYERVYPRN